MAEENVQRHYTGTAGKKYHESKRAVSENAFPWVARLRSEKFARHLTANETILEYGVGFGWNLAELKAKRRIGFDISDLLAPAVRSRGIEFVFDTKEIASGSIDVVICHHTLEHVLNPPSVLAEIARLLKANGKLLLHVPFEKERKYRSFQPAEPNHHLYSWNVQTLGNLVEESGFKVQEAGIGEFGYDRFAATQAEKWRIGEPGFRLLRKLLHLLKPGREVRIVALKKQDS